MQVAYNSKTVTNSAEAPSVDAEVCKQSLNGGSKSFHAASLLLPKAFASDATALYAFCRLTDDLIDNAVESAGKLDAAHDNSAAQATTQRVMQSLFDRLDRLYNGRPYPHPADRALLDVVERHQLPKSLLLSLFEGFAWDASGRKYETIEEVYAYGARVAGTVGVMMSVLMGVRDKQMIARAADMGIAMQLTNIARDVGEDARAGRLYLPRKWLREAGIDPEKFLANPVFCPALGKVISRLLDTADTFYARADSGIALLPRAVRPGMYAARLLYSEIGNEIRQLDYNSVDQRAIVSTSGKVRALTQLAKLPFLGTKDLYMDALAETNYLVEIISDQSWAPQSTQDHSPRPAEGIASKAAWVLDLFDQMDKREAGLDATRRRSGVSAS